MMPADDLTYMIRTPSDVHCNHCDTVNTGVDIYDDIRTGDWAYLFECRSCERINDEHGNDLERGTTRVASVVFTGGFVLTVGSLVSLFYTMPTTWHLVASLAGVALMLLPLTAAAIGWLTRNGHTQ